MNCSPSVGTWSVCLLLGHEFITSCCDMKYDMEYELCIYCCHYLFLGRKLCTYCWVMSSVTPFCDMTCASAAVTWKVYPTYDMSFFPIAIISLYFYFVYDFCSFLLSNELFLADVTDLCTFCWGMNYMSPAMRLISFLPLWHNPCISCWDMNCVWFLRSRLREWYRRPYSRDWIGAFPSPVWILSQEIFAKRRTFFGGERRCRRAPTADHWARTGSELVCYMGIKVHYH